MYTVKTLANKLKVTKATVYNYFKSDLKLKEEIKVRNGVKHLTEDGFKILKGILKQNNEENFNELEQIKELKKDKEYLKNKLEEEKVFFKNQIKELREDLKQTKKINVMLIAKNNYLNEKINYLNKPFYKKIFSKEPEKKDIYIDLK